MLQTDQTKGPAHVGGSLGQGFLAVVGGRHGKQVFPDGHVFKDLRNLEGAHHPPSGDLGRAQGVDAFSVQVDFARIEGVKAAYQVEERGFARAVGPDDGAELTGVEFGREAVDRNESPEPLGDLLEG